MNKKKINLSSLQVNSFVTETKEIKGGLLWTWVACSGDCDNDKVQ